jgi:hypothetical protein
MAYTPRLSSGATHGRRRSRGSRARMLAAAPGLAAAVVALILRLTASPATTVSAPAYAALAEGPGHSATVLGFDDDRRLTSISVGGEGGPAVSCRPAAPEPTPAAGDGASPAVLRTGMTRDEIVGALGAPYASTSLGGTKGTSVALVWGSPKDPAISAQLPGGQVAAFTCRASFSTDSGLRSGMSLEEARAAVPLTKEQASAPTERGYAYLPHGRASARGGFANQWDCLVVGFSAGALGLLLFSSRRRSLAVGFTVAAAVLVPAVYVAAVIAPPWARASVLRVVRDGLSGAWLWTLLPAALACVGWTAPRDRPLQARRLWWVPAAGAAVGVLLQELRTVRSEGYAFSIAPEVLFPALAGIVGACASVLGWGLARRASQGWARTAVVVAAGTVGCVGAALAGSLWMLRSSAADGPTLDGAAFAQAAYLAAIVSAAYLVARSPWSDESPAT